MNAEIRTAALTLWDYMVLGDEVGAAECMIVLGSRDDRVARYAAELAGQLSYDLIVLTGGIARRHDLLATKWSEADHFAAIMKREGYRGDLLSERNASNTGENSRLSYDLLSSRGEQPKSLLIVTKPYMERRAKATFEAQWPGVAVTIMVTSPKFSFDEYTNEDQPINTVLNIMVGYLQRIIDYPAHTATKRNKTCQNRSLLPNEPFFKLATHSICRRLCHKYYVDQNTT